MRVVEVESCLRAQTEPQALGYAVMQKVVQPFVSLDRQSAHDGQRLYGGARSGPRHLVDAVWRRAGQTAVGEATDGCPLVRYHNLLQPDDIGLQCCHLVDNERQPFVPTAILLNRFRVATVTTLIAPSRQNSSTSQPARRTSKVLNSPERKAKLPVRTAGVESRRQLRWRRTLS